MKTSAQLHAKQPYKIRVPKYSHCKHCPGEAGECKRQHFSPCIICQPVETEIMRSKAEFRPGKESTPSGRILDDLKFKLTLEEEGVKTGHDSAFAENIKILRNLVKEESSC